MIISERSTRCKAPAREERRSRNEILAPNIAAVEANYQRGVCNDTLPRELTMATQGNQPVTLIPAQPTTLLVGDRRISVDDWPLARIVDEKRSVEVAGSDDRLVIEPKRRSGTGRNGRRCSHVSQCWAFPSLVVGLVDLPAWLAVR